MIIDSLKKLFGLGSPTDFAGLVKKGAVIIDVRTNGEYSGGHIPKSINIPLDQLNKRMNVIKDKNTPVITCCASGIRSAAARKILLANGFAEVYNGGSWNSLQNKI